ncbi:MAG: hypothetical protein JNK15_18265 [Planctomycetes bacterium]|nr:hypothetical protein [Planctomycetota bacterium]
MRAVRNHDPDLPHAPIGNGPLRCLALAHDGAVRQRFTGEGAAPTILLDRHHAAARVGGAVVAR